MHWKLAKSLLVAPPPSLGLSSSLMHIISLKEFLQPSLSHCLHPSYVYIRVCVILDNVLMYYLTHILLS